MVYLISKLISWSDITFDMNTAMVSFKYPNIQLSLNEHCNVLFNIRILMSSLIPIFRIILTFFCVILFFTLGLDQKNSEAGKYALYMLDFLNI